MSYIEFFGTLLGLAAVWLAAKANYFTWHTGLLNAIAFFAIFYQIQLYADMFLQIFFFSACVYGLFSWNKQTENNEETIERLSQRTNLLIGLAIALCVVILGYLNAHIHEFFPTAFPTPASFPYIDAFTTATSIAAMILMAQKKIENWILWIAVDIVAMVVYYIKGVQFIAIEYFIFLIMSLIGLWRWWEFDKATKREHLAHGV